MNNFEDVMLKRLANCHVEACEEILASVKTAAAISLLNPIACHLRRLPAVGKIP